MRWNPAQHSATSSGLVLDSLHNRNVFFLKKMQVAAVCVVFGPVWTTMTLWVYDCHFRLLRPFVHSLRQRKKVKDSRCMHAPWLLFYLIYSYWTWSSRVHTDSLLVGDEQSNGLVWCCNGDAKQMQIAPAGSAQSCESPRLTPRPSSAAACKWIESMKQDGPFP